MASTSGALTVCQDCSGSFTQVNLIFMRILLDSYYYPHFTDGRSKAQRGYPESCPSKRPLHILFPSALLLLLLLLLESWLVLEPFYSDLITEAVCP